MRALCLLASGCIALAEGGYTNTLDPNSAGGGSVVVRAGVNTLDEADQHAVYEVALRGDVAASGSRGAIGGAVGYVPWTGWSHDVSPFVGGAVWLDPLRGGEASHDSILLPALELGVLDFPHASGTESELYSFGARVEWLGRLGDTASSVGWFVYAGIGTRSRLSIPR